MLVCFVFSKSDWFVLRTRCWRKHELPYTDASRTKTGYVKRQIVFILAIILYPIFFDNLVPMTDKVFVPHNESLYVVFLKEFPVDYMKNVLHCLLYLVECW